MDLPNNNSGRALFFTVTTTNIDEVQRDEDARATHKPARRAKAIIGAAVIRLIDVKGLSILAIGLLLVGGTLSLRHWVSLKSKQTFISGRVVSAKTKAPISDVMVAVDSPPTEDTDFSSFVRTDSDGKFVAEIKGNDVWMRVWKPRYLMNGLDAEASTLIGQPITIELREIEHPNLAIARSDVFILKSGDGYSLTRGEIVANNSADADIVIRSNPADKMSVIIESLGDGGVIYQRKTETLTFGAALEAPADGYQRQVIKNFSLYSSEDWFLFVRARDGKHYAKLALGIDVGVDPSGEAHIGLDSQTRGYTDPSSITCAYQPDGSRNLGANPTKDSFPFSAFGFDVNSLNR